MAEKGRGSGRVLGVGVTVLALGAGGAHLIWPTLKIDAITLLLLVIALLPWLGGLLESLELPGGYKVKYRDLAAKVEQTDQRAVEAASTANVAVGAARVDPTASNTMSELDGLVAEYTRLRAQPAGDARTAQLDQLFGRMTTVVPKIRGFDVDAALRDSDPGVRLAGYAALFAQPSPDHAGSLVDAMVREPTRFHQYWAIRTLGEVTNSYPEILTRQRRAVLRQFMNELPASGWRRVRLSAILGGADE